MGATGTAILDFGAFPGVSDASIAVTGQAAIVAGSLAEAWIRPVDTADHLADEHMVETIKVFAAAIQAGTGFTIYGFNTSQLNEPVLPDPFTGAMILNAGTAVVWRPATSPGNSSRGGGMGTRIWGKWTIAWAWN